MINSDTLRAARDRGVTYLLQRLDGDGAFPEGAPCIADYYKAVTAFQVTGHSAEAMLLCRWIRQNGFTPDGNFGPRQAVEAGDTYAYFNAWTVIGAHRLGQFDLSVPGMTFLLSFHDEISGGFYSSTTDRDADTPQDLMATCMCGLAALYMGKTGVAQDVGRWLQVLREAQPEFPERLYTGYTRSDGLITSFTPEEANRFVVVRDADYDQNIFNPGIACAFLCRLYQATGDVTWLDLARDYFTVAEGASDFLYHIVRIGKVGWAGALLYTITGESKYRETVIRIAGNLIELQSDGGYWCGVGQSTPSNDSTAERVVWLDEMMQVL